MTATFGAQTNGQQHLVVSGACQAVLMFGSVAPTIDIGDAVRLAEAMAGAFSEDAESRELTAAVAESPPLPGMEAWKDGYSLAESLLDDLTIAEQDGKWIDVRRVFEYFGIAIESIELADEKIRAVSIAGPNHSPVTLLNAESEYNRTEEGRRFTLAHELCHLLYDRVAGRQLAIASGPWAPLEIEQRANAFAAMFLMPTELINKTISDLEAPIETPVGLERAAEEFRTSASSTLEHLRNLSIVDDYTRDRILARLRSGEY